MGGGDFEEKLAHKGHTHIQYFVRLKSGNPIHRFMLGRRERSISTAYVHVPCTHCAAQGQVQQYQPLPLRGESRTPRPL